MLPSIASLAAKQDRKVWTCNPHVRWSD